MALVKLADPLIGSSWAKVELLDGDIVADLAKRACQEFPVWRVTAVEVSLYRVEWTGEDVPSGEAERTALAGVSLQPTWSLARARIVPNSCILVRNTAGAASAGACGGGFRAAEWRKARRLRSVGAAFTGDA